MKVIVATADTMEQWESWSYTLGVFSTIEVFDKWVRENYTVDDIVYNNDLLVDDKIPTYYIFNKDSVTDGSGDYYEVHIGDEDGCRYVDVGQYITLKEFEVIV